MGCLLFLSECVAYFFPFIVCRIGPQWKCLPFIQSFVVQILISMHNLYNSGANYIWEILMPLPAVLLITLAVWYKGRVTDEKKILRYKRKGGNPLS